MVERIQRRAMMRFWPWHRGGGSNRIRKDAGELRLADYETFPVWEFALDEEGVEGQTECTVRPVSPIVWPEAFDRIIAATMTSPQGDCYHGALAANSFAIKDADTPARLNVWILQTDGSQLDFSLGAEQHMSDDKARTKIAATYAALGTNASRLFPLSVRPHVPIPGLPKHWQLPGFMRAPHPSNRNEFLR
jgi:hypothetical protein